MLIKSQLHQKSSNNNKTLSSPPITIIPHIRKKTDPAPGGEKPPKFDNPARGETCPKGSLFGCGFPRLPPRIGSLKMRDRHRPRPTDQPD